MSKNTEKINNLKNYSDILIWDSDDPPPVCDSFIVYWKRKKSDIEMGSLNINEYLEQNADLVRAEYLRLVSNLGNRIIGEKTIVEILKVRPDFSIWWMSPIAEKCNFLKAPYIEDILRLIAIKKFLSENKVKSVRLTTSNKLLIKIFKDFCNRNSLRFGVTFRKSKKVRLKAKIFNKVPHLIIGLVWLLRRILLRLPLICRSIDNWESSHGSVVLLSYFFNFDYESAKSGHFESKYWGTLPQILSNNFGQIKWLHLYFENDQVPNARDANMLITNLNENKKGHVHLILDSFITLKVVYQVIKEWLLLRRVFKQTNIALQSATGKDFNFWPFFESDWEDAIKGYVAVSNLLHINLFESAISELKVQNCGIYLQENQPFEMAFIHCWNRANHGSLIGVPHATVKFWDLRYFNHESSFTEHNTLSMPRPDIVALNGKAAWDHYIKADYKNSRMRKVEALRYNHLASLTGRYRPPSDYKRLLVIGDISEQKSVFQLNMIQDALKHIPQKLDIVYKPHPASSLDLKGYLQLITSVKTSDLAPLLIDSDIVISSADSSAAVEASLLGVAVINTLDSSKLNMSPLKDWPGASFVSSPDELVNAILSPPGAKRSEKSLNEYFLINSKLPLWINLLEELREV